MGLLYEYSRADEFAYQQREPALFDELPDEQPPDTQDADTIDGAASDETPDERTYTGGDIAISSLVVLGSFLVLMFGTLFVFAFFMIFQNPALIESGDPNAAAEAIIEPYQEAYVLQYAYIATLYGLAVFIGTVFIAFRSRWDWRKLGVAPIERSRVVYALTMGAIGGAAIIGGSLASQNSIGALGDQITQLESVLQQTPPLLIAGAALLFIVLLPIVEEFFFRGVLYEYLRRRGGFIMALLISALVYASLNLNPTSFFANLALGAALALVFERTQSVWGAVLAHSTFNVITIILYLFVLM